MAKYKVVKAIDFGSGFVNDRTGKSVSMQSFAPKIGDIIELGEVETKTLWSSAPMQGYTFLIKQEGVTPDSKQWIMANAVEKVSDSTTITNTTNKGTTQKSYFTTKNIFIGLVVLAAAYYGLKQFKVIK